MKVPGHTQTKRGLDIEALDENGVNNECDLSERIPCATNNQDMCTVSETEQQATSEEDILQGSTNSQCFRGCLDTDPAGRKCNPPNRSRTRTCLQTKIHTTPSQVDEITCPHKIRYAAAQTGVPMEQF